MNPGIKIDKIITSFYSRKNIFAANIIGLSGFVLYKHGMTAFY